MFIYYDLDNEVFGPAFRQYHYYYYYYYYSYHMCPLVGGPKNFGGLWGVVDPQETRPSHVCYHTEFGRCRLWTYVL